MLIELKQEIKPHINSYSHQQHQNKPHVTNNMIRQLN